MRSLRKLFVAALLPNDARIYWFLRDHALNHSHGAIRSLSGIGARLVERRNGAFLPISSQIEHFVTPHGLSGIFISQGARVGSGCVIFHHVTLGSNTLADSRKPGAPEVGNNVYIGAGAKIIGAVRVGDNVRIGANCCVVSDIPDFATVVASPARVILHESRRTNVFEGFRPGLEADHSNSQ